MPTDQQTRGRAKTSASRIPPVAARPHPPAPELQPWIDKAKALPDVRWEKVQALRRALAEGEYDLDSRVNELIDQWPGERKEHTVQAPADSPSPGRDAHR